MYICFNLLLFVAAQENNICIPNLVILDFSDKLNDDMFLHELRKFSKIVIVYKLRNAL